MVLFQASRTSACTESGSDAYREYTVRDKGFFAILGSVLGRSAGNILLDHKEDIGYRIVERVIVFGKKGEGEYEYEQAKSFMILLSPCRQRPPTKVSDSSPTNLECLIMVLSWAESKLRKMIELLHSE